MPPFFSLSAVIKSLIYLPLFCCRFNHSMFSTSTLNDIIFWVIMPLALPPFLCNSFIVQNPLISNLSFLNILQNRALSLEFSN